MAQWTTFAGITGVVLVLLLVLSHLTQSAFSGDAATDDSSGAAPKSAATGDDRGDPPAPASRAGANPDSEPRRSGGRDVGSDPDGADPADAGRGDEFVDSASPEAELGRDADERPAVDAAETRFDTDAGRPRDVDPRSLSTGELLANVALSQGLFACVLLGAVVYTGIPVDALGIEFSLPSLERGLLLGTVAGVGLYVANEFAAAVATRFGFDHDEELRSMLAPDSTRGWIVLLVVVLPLIAGFEELLFRAALIGAVAAGFGVSPWLLAVVSSVAFAVGHGMQGSVGVVVTGLLGFVLAAIFVLTESFLVVVVAHYLVNALEFVVHEGLEFDWAETLES